MPYSGGFEPGYQCLLTMAPADAKIVSSGGSSFSDTVLTDYVSRLTTYTTATAGTQWQANVTDLHLPPVGDKPQISYSVSDITKATVDASGRVTYVAAGSYNLIATIASNGIYPSKTIVYPLVNTSSGGISSGVTTIIPATFSAATHVLVLWNTNSASSTTVKNYYIANRPGFSAANTLGLNCTVGEYITEENYKTTIRDAVVSWLNANPAKLIRYIVCMLDVPAKITGGGNYSVCARLASCKYEVASGFYPYISSGSANQYYYNTSVYLSALVTFINFGSVADCQGYIDKLATRYNAMSVPNVLISPAYSSPTYQLDEYNRIPGYTAIFSFDNTAILIENGSATVNYVNSGTHITSASNVTGYSTWGANGGQGGNYANDGSVIFTGNSDWFLIKTAESFNGYRSTGQGNFIDWFSSNAFGGTAYSKTPVGGVCHTEEPLLSGVNSSLYFRLWERGWNFAECAWGSKCTPFMMAVGDPMVRK